MGLSDGPGERVAPHASAAPAILTIAFTDLDRDPRVQRQIRFLLDRYRVTAAGFRDPEIAGVDFVGLRPDAGPSAGRWRRALLLALRQYERAYWGRGDVGEALRRLGGSAWDLVVANDLDTLPVALRLARGAPLLFDAHEFAPREFEEQWSFRMLHTPYRHDLCARYVPLAAAVTTVSEGIAEAYRRYTRGLRPSVVWNAPAFEPLEPSAVEEHRVRLVHHGGAQRTRGLERMIRMMRHLDERFELSLFLVGRDERYLSALQQEARGDPRIRFLEPVPMLELPRVLNRFDVGVYILPPTSFNNRHALPNKFFEFVQARLALAIGPSPEMRRLVEAHALGLVAADFEPRSLAARLTTLTPQALRAFKANSQTAARALSSEPARVTLLSEVERCLRTTHTESRAPR